MVEEVLNDINGDLVTLYRVVQNHLEAFVRQFKWALSSRQVFGRRTLRPCSCRPLHGPAVLADRRLWRGVSV